MGPRWPLCGFDATLTVAIYKEPKRFGQGKSVEEANRRDRCPALNDVKASLSSGHFSLVFCLLFLRRQSFHSSAQRLQRRQHDRQNRLGVCRPLVPVKADAQ